MAPTNVYPTFGGQRSESIDEKDEKDIGVYPAIDTSVIESPVELLPQHAAEYLQFLQLKEHFESDPKAYKKLVRRRMFFFCVYYFSNVVESD
jgi:hypothetical protein